MRLWRTSEAQWPIPIISLGTKLFRSPRSSGAHFLSSYCAIPPCFPFCGLPFAQHSHFRLQKVGEEFSFQSVLASAPNTDCFRVSMARRFMEKALRSSRHVYLPPSPSLQPGGSRTFRLPGPKLSVSLLRGPKVKDESEKHPQNPETREWNKGAGSPRRES